MSVFVFVVKEGFDLPCLPQDYKNKIEISELVEFFNKRMKGKFLKKLWSCVGGEVVYKNLVLSTELIM